MLREFRGSDAAEMSSLLDRHFPEENRLLGKRPGEFEKIVRRVQEPQFRLILGFLKLIGRPVYRLYIVEDGGHVAATAYLAYLAKTGYIGMVMVDTPYRRRGYAARVVQACLEAARKSGRPYGALDVLELNEPARRLYSKLGFRWLETKAYYSLMLPEVKNGSDAPASPKIRQFRRRDAKRLIPMLEPATSPEVREVFPVDPRAFTTAPLAARALLSETEAWVTADSATVRGFVRATVSPTWEAANLTVPVLDASLPDEDGLAMVRQALDWASRQGAPRIVTEVPVSAERATRLLKSMGFVEAVRLLTLYRPTAG